MENLAIRSATYEDLPEIHQILEHYVLNTVISFRIKPQPLSYIRSRFEETVKRGLPYIVAAQADTTHQNGCRVLGCASASAFRASKLGYGPAVEISIFCHPDFLKRGIGSKMLRELVDRLRHCKHTTSEVGFEEEMHDFEVKRVLAVMAVDNEEQDDSQNINLRDWYLRQGFKQVGRLEKIGFKNGRR